MQRLIIYLLLPILSLLSFTCQQETKPPSSVKAKEKEVIKVENTITDKSGEVKSEPKPAHLVYSFQNADAAQNLTDLIPTPKGFKRIAVVKNSFAEWLRYLPAKPRGTAVKLFNGSLKPNQDVHEAVVDIDVGKRDLQQCADAVMRLRAEYLYGKQEYSKIHFNFTSGDKVAFDDWSRGRKPKINGNNVSFSNAGNSIDASYANFKKYLTMIFSYAGTASLSKELASKMISEMEIGDVFIQGGFPGHAVIVTDMAENNAGEKVFLLAQSYMPAQDIHILKNYTDNELSPWFSQGFGNQLNTPEWTFYKNDLKEF